MYLKKKKFKDKGLQELLSGTSIAIFFKLCGTGSAFLFTLLLARSYGAEEAGLFFICFSLSEVLAMTARLGLAQSSIAFIGRYSARGDWSSIKGIFRKSVLFIVLASVIISAVTFLLAEKISIHIFSDERLTALIRIAAFSVTPISLVRLFGNSLQGLQHIMDSQFILECSEHFFLLIGLISIMFFFGISGVVAAYVVTGWITVGIGTILWGQRTKHMANVKASFPSRKLFATALPLMWANLLMIINSRAGTFALGIFSDPSEVAVYNISFRISMLTNFLLISINAVCSPKFAALHGQGNMEELARNAQQSTILIIVTTLPLVVPLLIFPEFVLSFFGEGFTGRGSILSLLIIGQCVNIASGPVGMLLAMSGKEKCLRNVYFIGTPLNIILQVVLIPYFAAKGAAFATTVSVIFLNIAAVYLVYKELGISILPNPMNLFIKRKAV